MNQQQWLYIKDVATHSFATTPRQHLYRFNPQLDRRSYKVWTNINGLVICALRHTNAFRYSHVQICAFDS